MNNQRYSSLLKFEKVDKVELENDSLPSHLTKKPWAHLGLPRFRII
jgi:hypothetical protein